MINVLLVLFSLLSFATGIAIAQTRPNDLSFIGAEKPVQVAGDMSSILRGRIDSIDFEHNTIVFATTDRFGHRKENLYTLALKDSTTIGETSVKEASASALAQRIAATMLDKKIKIIIKNSDNTFYATMILIPRTVNP
jgi:hypothetical protein